MYSCIRMPVNRSRFRSNKQFLTVGRELVTVEVFEITFACSIHIEHHFHFFTCLEGIFNNLCAFAVHLCVVFTVGRGDYSLNVFRAETSGGDIF